MSDSITIAYFHDPVKWRNPQYPQYPKPCVRDRLAATSMKLIEVTVQDVLGGSLERDNFNILLVPGGFAPHWSDALGYEGQRIIQQFVSSGGGYVGLCAGAYYGVWSGLLPAEIVDIEYWKRGSTNRCEIRWTNKGVDTLGAPAVSHVRYNNGPILRGTSPAATSLADFVTELRGAKNAYPPAMAGNSAVLSGFYGKGRVVLVSPHIESSTDAITVALFCNLFRHAAAVRCERAPDKRAIRSHALPSAPSSTRAGPKAMTSNPVTATISPGSAPMTSGSGRPRPADPSSSDDDHDSGNEHDMPTGGDNADQDDQRVERPPALGANANAPVRLLARAQPRAPSRPDSSRRGAVQFGTSAATQKLRAARLAATAAANARSAPPGASATRAPPPSSDGYSSSESYVCSLGAPLLFTAPHGLKLKRGTGPSQSARDHAREQYTSELVLKLSAKFAEHRLAQAAVTPSSSASSEVTPPLASFMVWNYKTAAVDDPSNMDPNYLTCRTAVHSPWHSSLHAWKAANGYAGTEPCPRMLHVDVHGKMDRKDSMAIDIGMMPMEEEGCLQRRAVDQIRSRLADELRAAFSGRSAVSSKSKQTFPITVEEHPQLHGWWGSGTAMTMSHQAAMLGATAVQFELPNAVRKLLMADGVLFDAFATAIFNTYEALVSTGVAEQSRPGWEDDSDTGRYLEHLGTARQPLKELAVTPMLGTEGVAAMLRDLERAEMGSVHGKSI